MYITAAILRAKGACASQRDRFATLFPDGVEITEAACVAVAAQFDWEWAARHLLPPAALADYEAKRAPIDADYEAKLAPIWADYEAKHAALFGRLVLAHQAR